jgi:hypothetical protein
MIYQDREKKTIAGGVANRVQVHEVDEYFVI